MNTSITIEASGRRYYLRGNTYPVRDALRAAGAHWDRDAQAWWVGKRDVAEQLLARLSGASPSTPAAAESSPSVGASETVGANTAVVGRARYKGREYLVLWVGETRRGRAAKLAFTDGSKVFWADESEVQITKTYQTREWRGRREPMTFGRLTSLREEYSAQRAAERDCGLVGETGAYVAQYSASRDNRLPNERIGDVTWLRHRSVRIAVVLVGYEAATHLREEDAEDMGHYGVKTGWYGTAHYRDASFDEYAHLQARAPREDGTCTAIGRAVVDALASLAVAA